ncbi:hypothetical protein QJS10_CPB18g01873 [Acorus calamus]|uniref:Uncharacterized protein n=1 Tax=Acorus calamus TaxID=4465 RepID=A0AAV9CMW3_ACOCL|nr:hypothetical protein QJS10_CPB18g01873 [Acorus calamus]
METRTAKKEELFMRAEEVEPMRKVDEAEAKRVAAEEKSTGVAEARAVGKGENI